MSWLSKVLGGKSAQQWLDEAAAHETAGALGEAKLAFDRAYERARGAAEVRARAEAGAVRCCDGLARERLASARQLLAQGSVELAREELQNALETARSQEVEVEVQAVLHGMEREDAVEVVAEGPTEPGAEERFALIAGNWEELQAEELETYGDALADALVKLDAGDAEAARTALEALIDGAKEPRYLWLELGRAQLAVGQTEEGARSLRTFLSRIGPDEGGNARLLAHSELAQLAHDRGDIDAAVAELEACADALDEDPRPLLQLGSYLRHAERPAEAVEVLELCQTMFTEGPVEWPVLAELGLSRAAAGDAAGAVSALESVIDTFASRGELDFPPRVTTTLAELHEQRGNLARAADLYRSLAAGGDVQRHGHYHDEAARLLDALGLSDEAERMRQRARAVSPPGSEQTTGET